MQKRKSLFFPMLLFITSAFAAWYSGNLAQIVKEAETAQLILSRVLQTGVWFSAAFLVIRAVQIFIWDGFVSAYLGVPVPRLIRDMGAGIILLIACSGVAGIVFERDITGILATSGLIGIVVGFSLQTIILDVFTGLAIHVDRPFSIGEWIKMFGDMKGLNAKVLEINWRTTRLKTESNEMIIVPNSVLGKMILSNFNQPDLPTRFQVEIHLDPLVPPDRCRRILLAGVLGTECVLEEPAPVVLLNEVDASGLTFIVRYWIKPWQPVSPTTAADAVLTNLVDSLQYAGIAQGTPRVVNLDAKPVNSSAPPDVKRDRVAILRKQSLFESLQESELESLAMAAIPEQWLQGDTIIRQGDEGNSMYILVEGLLNVYRSVEGKNELMIGRIRTGRYFGEMSLMTGEPRSATIRAAMDTLVLKIDKSAMADLLENRPELIEQLSKSLAQRRQADKRRDSLADTATEDQTASLADQIRRRIVGFFNLVFNSQMSHVENGKASILN